MAPFWHFLLALTVTLSFLHLLPLSSSSSSSTSDLFDAWCKHHGKTYSSEQEYQYRLRVFEDNLAFVTQHNNNNNIGNNSSYKLSLNVFADLTHHEFKTSRFGSSTSFAAAAAAAAIRNADFFNRKPTVGEFDVVVRDVPSSVDWRKKGAVTHVKDQERCGACWAFAATGAMEGINKIVTGSLVSLSEQELIDCDTSSNNGCRGGLMDYAYQFVLDNHGIDTEQDYPYQAYQDFCNQGKLNRRVVTIDGYTDIPPNNNEKQLLQAVAARPVSVGISGSGRSFQFYSEGIFNGPCSDVLDHAVLIVGYGSENGVDYWIVKNSWGTRWGMGGYVYMIRNGYPHGACGINLMPSYPTKTSLNPPTPPSPSPPPAPSPTRCDIFTSCLEGETCCCTWNILGICFSWKCCELDSAVCCNDHLHCCPHDYPVCDTNKNQCLKHADNVTAMEALEKRGSFSSFFEALIF